MPRKRPATMSKDSTDVSKVQPLIEPKTAGKPELEKKSEANDFESDILQRGNARNEMPENTDSVDNPRTSTPTKLRKFFKSRVNAPQPPAEIRKTLTTGKIIHVLKMTGAKETYSVTPNTPVSAFRKLLKKEASRSSSDQAQKVLVYHGELLLDSSSLDDVEDGSIIFEGTAVSDIPSPSPSTSHILASPKITGHADGSVVGGFVVMSSMPNAGIDSPSPRAGGILEMTASKARAHVTRVEAFRFQFPLTCKLGLQALPQLKSMLGERRIIVSSEGPQLVGPFPTKFCYKSDFQPVPLSDAPPDAMIVVYISIRCSKSGTTILRSASVKAAATLSEFKRKVAAKSWLDVRGSPVYLDGKQLIDGRGMASQGVVDGDMLDTTVYG